jgi:hypothetical protein
MEWITLPQRPPDATWELLYGHLRQGRSVMLCTEEGIGAAEIREALGRRGFLVDTVDGGPHGLLVLPTGACA